MLLSGDRRPTTCPRPKPFHSDHHFIVHSDKDLHQHTYLYEITNRHLDPDSNLDPYHDDHTYANCHVYRQRYSYIYMDSYPYTHFHAKLNADIHTNAITNIYFHADGHRHRHPHPANLY